MAICFSEKPMDYPYRKVTEGTLTLQGKETVYTAISGDTAIFAPDGHEMGTIFSFSYLLEGDKRPVLFIFNGGPGSSSTWLQLGFLAPRIAVPDEDGMPRRQAPYALRDNPDCLLDLCDLVFYNPPGAGYARLFDEADAALAFGDHADADVAEAFIRSWLREHGEERPVFLLGESFGSTRASLLAYRLSDLDLRGVLHVGPGYTGYETIPRAIKDLLPCAATHWFYDPSLHTQTLEAYLAPVRTFLYREYFPALCLGSQISQEEKQHIAERLAAYTGLSEAYYLSHRLLVSRQDFRALRLADQGLKIGSFDTRFTLPADEDTDPTLAAFDPYIDAAARAHYLEDLGLSLTRAFRENSFDADNTFLWPFNAQEDMEGLGGSWYPMQMTVSDAAAKAWEKRPNLRFFFATGVFDTVATIENTRFAVTHTRVPLSHVTMKEYASGHAVYADDRSRHLLALDIRSFLSDICK